MSFDLSIYHFFNNFLGQSKFLDSTIVFFAEYFPYFVIAFFLILVIYFRKTFRERFKLGVQSASALIISRIFLEIIRFFYVRVRPFEALGGNFLLTSSEASFPSGHATLFFCIATIIYLENKSLGILFYIFAIVISLARISAGLHYPIDILGGAILGILTTLAIHKFISKKKIS